MGMGVALLTDEQSADANTLAHLGGRYLVHPHQTLARPGRQVFVRGDGCSEWDAEGNDFLDAMGAGNWLAQVGRARPEPAAVTATQIGGLGLFSCWREYANIYDRSVPRR
jgi:PLP-dependent transaminase